MPMETARTALRPDPPQNFENFRDGKAANPTKKRCPLSDSWNCLHSRESTARKNLRNVADTGDVGGGRYCQANAALGLGRKGSGSPETMVCNNPSRFVSTAHPPMASVHAMNLWHNGCQG